MTAPGLTLVASQPPTAAPERVPLGPRVTAWARPHAVLIVLALVPFAVFGVPVLFGHAVLDGDNLLQNFPLRSLAGRDIAHGMLPLWNPYLFSGTPLLAGFNAGAAYPATWLMAVLPGSAAWALSFAAVYDLALVGMYLFLRRQSICRAAATFGAATFAFAGYMTAQVVHVDLIEGAASLPWMLLAVHGLTEPPDPAGARPWGTMVRRRGFVALLAVALGLAAASGGVEATIDGAVLVTIYWASRLVTSGYLGRRARRRGGVHEDQGAPAPGGVLSELAAPAVTFVVGLAGGAALGAAQLLPGGVFAAHSQRSGSSYAFFTSGSLPERLVSLLVSPFVLGTNQDRPAFYAGPYNFPEVTSYVGILALIAACVLLVRRWRTSPLARHWYVWYVVLAVGFVSALGNQTPFARLLYLVPGINSQRLLNRNLLLVDCALAVLFAWWSHLALTMRDPAAPKSSPFSSRWRGGRRAELVATCAPFTLSALFCLALWIAGPALYHLLEASVPVTESTRLALAPLVTAGTVIAGVATWIVLAEARFSTRTLRYLLGAVLATDLVLFNCFVIRPPVPESQARATTPAAAAFARVVGEGRFIVFDPDRFYGDQLIDLGQTDLNVFRPLPSAQGYTALTDATYYRATGAHLQENLDPATLAGPVWDQLNVTTLLSLPGYFLRPVRSPAPPGIPFPADAFTGRPAAGAARPSTLAAGAVRQWFFGGVLRLQRWTVPLERGSGPGLKAGLLTPTGSIRWLPPARYRVVGAGEHRILEVVLPTPEAASGVVLRSGTGGTTVGVLSARTLETGPVTLDGPMQRGVGAPHWAFAGTFGAFGVFHNTAARGWAWLDPGGGAGTAASTGATVSASGPGVDGNQQIDVHATGPVVLDRSESWSSGWEATVRSRSRPVAGPLGTGPAVHPPVTRDGVVQRVAIPGPGDYEVTFAYRPASALVGIVVSALMAGALVLWGIAELVVRRRRRRRPRRPGPGSGSSADRNGPGGNQSGTSSPMAPAARR